MKEVSRYGQRTHNGHEKYLGQCYLGSEISASTLNDDLGRKRLLYERLNVQEYWVVDVQAAEVIAFEIFNGGSRRIQTSLVLPDLEIAIVEDALQRSKTEDDGTINRWLLKALATE